MNRPESKGDRSPLAQSLEDIEQGKGVLASGDADHNSFTLADHLKILDRLPSLATQPLAELVIVDRCFHISGSMIACAEYRPPALALVCSAVQIILGYLNCHELRSRDFVPMNCGICLHPQW